MQGYANLPNYFEFPGFIHTKVRDLRSNPLLLQ